MRTPTGSLPLGRRERWRRERWPDAATSLRSAAVVVLVVMAWQFRWVHDDGFINLRVVRNLLDGDGPVFNPAQRVEAFTSPLWVLTLAAGRIATLGKLSPEMVAVVAGIGLSAVGLWLASRAHGRLPIGVLLFAVSPLAWTWATAGLEFGLSAAWLGAVAACLRRAPRRIDPWVLALGPLIRPEFAVVTAIALVATMPRDSDTGDRAGWIGGSGWWRVAIAAVPLCVLTLARAAYFATLVPNTVIAKSSSFGDIGSGLAYVLQTIRVTWLLVPLAAAAVLVTWRRRSNNEHIPGEPTTSREAQAVVILLGASAALLALVIVGGGDYMYARLVMPPLFLAAVAFTIPRTVDGLAERMVIGVLIAWAVAGATVFGFHKEPGDQTPHGARAFDQRAELISDLGTAHPVYAVQHRRGWAAAATERLITDARGNGSSIGTSSKRDRDMLVWAGRDATGRPTTFEVDRKEGDGLAVIAPAIGAVGVLYPDVTIVDMHGLADPLAARLDDAETPERLVGHQRVLSPPWAVAEWGLDARTPVGAPPVWSAQFQATYRAWRCGGANRLRRAVSEPLTWSTAWANFRSAPANTTFSLPAGPLLAEQAVCSR